MAEDRARRNVGRLLRFLIALAVLGGLTWLALSPYLSVHEVRTAGVAVSSTHRILAESGLVAGTPMVLVRAGAVEDALEDDPWIAEARVHLDWPDRVIVRVVERAPLAWVETGNGWTRRSIDGFPLPSPIEPDPSLAWVQLPWVEEEGAADHRDLLGALEFIAALPDELQATTLVRSGPEGELWAQVDGYQVRLGRAVEMGTKAKSLIALLAENPDPNSILTLIAPTHPAVSPEYPAPTPGEESAPSSEGDAESEEGAAGDEDPQVVVEGEEPDG